jgi:GNAT superfamily N-acetyltransferase
MSVEIRPARADEVDAVLPMYGWLFAPPGSEPPAWNPDRAGRALAEAITSPESVVLVADRDGSLVGLCTAYLELNSVRFGQRCWIEDLAVDPSRRSEGVGAALLDAAADWARRRGATHLELDSGMARTDAHRFYERRDDQGIQLLLAALRVEPRGAQGLGRVEVELDPGQAAVAERPDRTDPIDDLRARPARRAAHAVELDHSVSRLDQPLRFDAHPVEGTGPVAPGIEEAPNPSTLGSQAGAPARGDHHAFEIGLGHLAQHLRDPLAARLVVDVDQAVLGEQDLVKRPNDLGQLRHRFQYPLAG